MTRLASAISPDWTLLSSLIELQPRSVTSYGDQYESLQLLANLPHEGNEFVMIHREISGYLSSFCDIIDNH